MGGRWGLVSAGGASGKEGPIVADLWAVAGRAQMSHAWQEEWCRGCRGCLSSWCLLTCGLLAWARAL